jgi:hypothetical protein
MRETISHASPFFLLSEVGERRGGCAFPLFDLLCREEGRVIFCFQGVVTNL